MQISKIKTESTTEVKGKVADIVYFQKSGGKLLYIQDILDALSPLSSVVVLAGEEPSLQYKEVIQLIEKIDDKKVVLETSSFDRHLHYMCDKVVFTFKTHDMVHQNVIEHINNHLEKHIPVVVVGHEQFNKENFASLCKNLDMLYVRFQDDINVDLSELSQIAEKYNTELIELEKISL